jgi:protein-S-isoprenylcysteine O-methyltransferase Ste14
MKRLLALVYGLAAYAISLATTLYAVGFIGNLLVPKTLDSEPHAPWAQALLVNLLLLLVFALQHSVMARPGFKRVWTRVVPEPLERSTYVLASSLALMLLFWLWQPMGGTVWRVQDPVGQALLYGLYALGWLVVLGSTYAINHWDLFGLRQVYYYWRNAPRPSIPFTVPGPYRYVRHPLYLGWLLAFWAAPTMTLAHLVFAAGTTLYILVAIRFEERDLISFFGDSYRQYRTRVAMIIPLPGKTLRR